MFGHASQPARIFSYGAKQPEPIETVSAEMQKAFDYYNNLIRCEIKRRQTRTAKLHELRPKVALLFETWQTLNTEIEEQRRAMRADNAKARKHVQDPAKKAQIAQVKKDCSAAWKEYKAARNAALKTETIKAQLKQIDDAATAEHKQLRKTSGLYWGTYLTVDAAFKAARSSVTEPRTRRWDGRGKLSVQLQNGLSVDKLMAGTDNRLRVQVIPQAELRKVLKNKNARVNPRRPWCYLYFRVGSQPKSRREPLWVRIVFRLHRELPENVMIKWCYLQRKRIATQFTWNVQFVIAAKEETVFSKPCASSGRVGVDVGYRRVQGGIRVAYWSGDDGREAELVLPDEWLSSMTWVTELASIRDNEFNVVLASFRTWLASKSNLPEWLTEQTTHVHQWRSQNRLARLTLHWRDNRFPGDTEILAALEAWRKQDKHYYERQENLRDKLIAKRRKLYERFAADLRERYHTVVVEKLNLKQLQITTQPEFTDPGGAVDYHQRNAALSVLFQTLKESGMEYIQIDPENTTRTCHACGHINKFAEPANLFQTCDECGTSWDQDKNAALILLNANSEEAAA